MFILKEKTKSSIIEESFELAYTDIDKKGVWAKIIEWKKKNYKLITYMSFDIADYTIIGGLYNKIKFEGAQLKLLDTRTPFNFYWLAAKDIVSAKLAENTDTNYQALSLTMRGKYTVQIRPA